ncbi:cellulase family glycosylhydrolase [Elioraea rosea]|uniref:cellulase family glycosylhydrolase n=1 Tax=Elioraea rosea TaxID=2492390 RepID=UPI001186BE07|nr:cellulase family glycosylhydrolase [Elioraea rosea]
MTTPYARMAQGLGVNIERGFAYLAGGGGRPRPFSAENARYLRENGVSWVRVFFDCFQVPGQGSDFVSPPLQPIIASRADEGILGFPTAWRWPWEPGTTIVANREVVRSGVRIRPGQPYPFVRVGRAGSIELAGERTQAADIDQLRELRLMQPTFFLNNEPGKLRLHFDTWARSIDALIGAGLVVVWTIFGKNLRDYADAGRRVGEPGFGYGPIAAITEGWAGWCAARWSPDDLVIEEQNEAVYDSYEQWRPIRDARLAAMRRAAPDHWLMVGGHRWGSLDSLLAMTPWADPRRGGSRVIYGWHGYEPASVPARDLVRRGAEWGRRHRVPVAIGEWDTGNASFGSRFENDADPRRVARLIEMRDAAREAGHPLAYWCVRQAPGHRILNTVEDQGGADRIRFFPEMLPVFRGA